LFRFVYPLIDMYAPPPSPIITHHHPSSPIITHHHPSPPITTHHQPSPTIDNATRQTHSPTPARSGGYRQEQAAHSLPATVSGVVDDPSLSECAGVCGGERTYHHTAIETIMITNQQKFYLNVVAMNHLYKT
jgi:hypothetical protein